LSKLIFRNFPEISGTPRIKKGEIEKHSRKIDIFGGVFPRNFPDFGKCPLGKNFQNFPKFPEIFRKFSRNFSRKFPGFWTRGKTKIQPVNLSFFSSKSSEISPGFSPILGNFGNSEIPEISGFSPQKK
jgi:hypothetical protein